VRNLLIAAAGAALLVTPALARETAWMGIGSRIINAQTPSQTIEVRGTNVPRETMFCADDAAVQIVSAEFRYRTGEPQTLTLRARVRAGDCSRIIGLRNRDGELTSVSFSADPASIAAGATARVRVLVR
jgi:hypothetical protein